MNSRSLVLLAMCVALFAVAACAGDNGASVPPGIVPVLTEFQVPGLVANGPERGQISFAVARDGRLAFTGGFNEKDNFLTVIDTAGRIERFGRRGQGPGEFSPYVFLSFVGNDEELIVYDQIQERVVRYAGARLISTQDVDVPEGWPVNLSGDSIDYTAGSLGSEVAHAGILRVSTENSGTRMMVAPDDSTYAALFVKRRPRLPMVATTKDRIVVVNQFIHAFQSFDVNGRPLQTWGKNLPEQFRSEATLDSLMKGKGPGGGYRVTPQGMKMRLPTSAEERRMLATDRQRYVHSIKFDEPGRLWVFGKGDDSAGFADIYRDSTHIGRIALPCRQALFDESLRGNWLALLCAAPETDAGMRLRLFRLSTDRK